MAPRRRRRSRSFKQRVEDIRHEPRQLTLAILGTLVVLTGLLFTWEAFRAVNALQEAESRADVLRENIVDGDIDAARRSLEQFDASTSRAHNSTNGPDLVAGRAGSAPRPKRRRDSDGGP